MLHEASRTLPRSWARNTSYCRGNFSKCFGEKAFKKSVEGCGSSEGVVEIIDVFNQTRMTDKNNAEGAPFDPRIFP